MKKLILITLLTLTVMTAYSQTDVVVFTKIIENRHKRHFEGKDMLDRRFFGDRIYDVEYAVNPAFDEAYGFCIAIDTVANECTLETRRVLDRASVDSLLDAKYPLPVMTAGTVSSKEERDEQMRMAREMMLLREYERWKSYDVEGVMISISYPFARKICEAVASAIENCRAYDSLTDHPVDGELIAFRVPAGHELWTLRVHSPWCGETKRLAVIFSRMITDAAEGTLDETKYIESLMMR